MKKLIIVLWLLWCNVGFADDNPFIEILEIQTSFGESHTIHLYNRDNYCDVQSYLPLSCSYTRNGNKFYINIQGGTFILEGTKSYFSKKVKGIWKNRSKGSSTETFWGTLTSNKIKTN